MIDIGHTIGNYKITAKLGEGGMGVVYLAEHPVIGKKVAMKAIHPELSKNSDVVSRFITEAKAVNQIGHEHIVDIADFGNTPRRRVLLRDGVPPGRVAVRPPQARETRISHSVRRCRSARRSRTRSTPRTSRGSSTATSSPRTSSCATAAPNRDFVKVLDFGLAKLTQDDQKVTHKTRTGSVMGTPYYMSPEQCEGKIEIDHRADIYSLGVLLFEMLTGKVPFGGEGYGEIIVKHVTMPPPSVRSIVPELPEYLDLILYRVLAKDRDQRFQTMAELREALLDPERYASSAPEIGIPDDLSGIARAAAPDGARRDGRALAQLGYGLAASSTPPPPGGTPSTFREGRGENIDNLIPDEAGSRSSCCIGALRRSSRSASVRRSPRAASKRRRSAAASLPLHPSDGARELQLRSRRRGRPARRRQDAGPDAAVDRGALQRLGGRVPVQEAGLRDQDDVRRPQPPVAAVRDAAPDRGADAATAVPAAAGDAPGADGDAVGADDEAAEAAPPSPTSRRATTTTKTACSSPASAEPDPETGSRTARRPGSRQARPAPWAVPRR